MAASIIPQNQEKTLIVMTERHLGNTVITLPVLKTLAKYFTNPVDYLIDERFAPLVKLIPSVQNVILYPNQSKKRRGIFKNIRSGKMMAKLMLKRYQTVIDVAGGIRAATVTLFTQAKTRVGYSDTRRNFSYNVKIDRHIQDHIFTQYSSILKCIDHHENPSWINLKAPQSSSDKVNKLIMSLFKDPQKKLAVIHPSTGDGWRLWPIDRFARVADHFISTHDMNIAVIGTPSEKELGHNLINLTQNKEQIKFMSISILDLLALFEQADLLLSNESGPTHLASTTSIPIVTIFGPTKEYLWKPVRQDKIVLLRGVDCQDACRRRSCTKNMPCLNDVYPEDMIKQAEVLLNL